LVIVEAGYEGAGKHKGNSVGEVKSTIEADSMKMAAIVIGPARSRPDIIFPKNRGGEIRIQGRW